MSGTDLSCVRASSCEMNDRFVVGPTRIRYEHFITWIDDRHQRRIKRTDSASGDNDIVRRQGLRTAEVCAFGHLLAQSWQAGVGGYLVQPDRAAAKAASMICVDVEKSGSPTSR